MGFASYIALLIPLVCTEGLLNPSVFKTSDMIKISFKGVTTALFQGGSYGDSDEDLFISLFNEKQNNEADIERKPFMGAGVPTPSLQPEDIVPLLMTALENNNVPEVDAGLVSMWEFATDTTKFIFQNNITGK